MTTGTPEYRAINNCRVELTEKLCTCFKGVAEYLCQSGELNDKQCQEIIYSKDGAEKLMKSIIIDIKNPKSAMDSFANFVTAIKKSGTENFQIFVKEEIEAERKKFYRKLLTVRPGMW